MASRRARALQRSIAANVRRLRVAADLTQEGLAEKSAVDARYIQTVERGEANLTIGVLTALAQALAVDERELLEPAQLVPARAGRPPRRPA